MLAALVESGDLPPVDERLPKDPMVVQVVDSIGEYGGTWHTLSWEASIPNIKMKLYDPIVRWKRDYTGYEPGLASDFGWSDDGKTITFHLREGLKWSDGAPYTTEDLQFWWEDMAKNEDHKVVSVPWWARTTDGDPIEMEFPDDTTWVLHFDKAQWIMPYVLAQGFWEWEPLMKPKHYLTQFHPNYDGSDYDELDQMDRWWENPDYPVLFAWHVVDYRVGELTILERNPYYWKVDPEGNQLPYIDQMEIEIVPDPEVRVLQMGQGKYDASFRGSRSPNDIPFLLEQAEAGGYHLQKGWMDGAAAWPGWMINQDYHVDQEYDADAEAPEDVEIRELLRNQDFRKGLSFALDRDRVVDVVWEGIGEAKQFTISPQSWHFVEGDGPAIFEEWAAADTDYDPDRAMALFDGIGFVDADGDGWRDLPSGAAFTLIIDQNDWGGERITIPSNEVFKGNLEEVGVQVLINNVIGQPDASTRGNYGLFMLRNTHASEIDLWTYPDWVFPLRGGGEGSRAFPMQGLYYQTGGEEGWEPEPGSSAAKLQDIYRRGLSEPDEMKRHELIWEAVQVHMEEGPFVLGAAGDQPFPVIVKDNFHNVPEYGVLGPWAPGSPGNTNPVSTGLSSSNRLYSHVAGGLPPAMC
jgi:peptide/nickel transport system substrate-binding protein